jgi:hypothetical protein
VLPSDFKWCKRDKQATNGVFAVPRSTPKLHQSTGKRLILLGSMVLPVGTKVRSAFHRWPRETGAIFIGALRHNWR